MRRNIRAELFPHLHRPPILGEYPYYRADPAHWESNLAALRRLGIDAVTFYIPWRFHELEENGSRIFDFIGRTDPQRDVCGFLRRIADAGLCAIAKPGPFIHAEVQLGGLPDRLCGPYCGTPAQALAGTPLTSQGQALPSFWDKAFQDEVSHWLAEVSAWILAPHRAPAGPIIGVQIGNEGLYSDANRPLAASTDASSPAMAAFWSWVQEVDPSLQAGFAISDPERLLDRLRHLWVDWSGLATTEAWRRLADSLPAGMPTLVNIPLARIADTASVGAWSARGKAFSDSPHLLGHTEWLGNAAAKRDIFLSHLMGIRLGQTDVVEGNWGFTWTDATFAEPGTPLFHALLGLALGSTTCSIYTACATESWNRWIDMDAAGLRAEGVDPALHQPPYCPGAPTTEAGGPGATAAALSLLSAFLSTFGECIIGTTLVADARLLIDRALSAQEAWLSNGPSILELVAAEIEAILLRDGIYIDPLWRTSALQEAAGPSTDIMSAGAFQSKGKGDRARQVRSILRRLAAGSSGRSRCASARQSTAILRRRSHDGAIEVVSLFNVGGLVDEIRLQAVDAVWILRLPPGAAVMLVLRDGALAGWLVTPWANAAGDAEEDDATRWFGANDDSTAGFPSFLEKRPLAPPVRRGRLVRRVR